MERSLGFRYFSLSQNADCEEFFCSTLSLAKVVRLVRSTTVAGLLHWASMSGCQMYMFIFHVTWSASKFGKTVCKCVVLIHAFSALTLLVGRQEQHPAYKNWVMRCWCGYLSGARCRFFCMWSSWCHCHPQTPSSLASFKSRLVLPFCYWLIQAVLEKRPSNGSSSSNSSCVVLVQGVLGTFSLALIAPVNPR